MSDARATVLALLDARAAAATVCPSEVARALAAAAGDPDWRGRMAAVHAAVDALAADGAVRLSWRGEAMPARDGPYRIGRARAAVFPRCKDVTPGAESGVPRPEGGVIPRER